LLWNTTTNQEYNEWAAVVRKFVSFPIRCSVLGEKWTFRESSTRIMEVTNVKDKRTIVPLLLLLSLLLAACGTLEVGVESTATPDNGSAATATAPADENAHLLAQATAPVETAAAPPEAGTVVITGTVAALDFPDGWAFMVPDFETPFANENGMIKALISEWARVTDADDAVFAREDLSKGARLEILVTPQDEGLIAEQVVVLSPGVPPVEDNPAYTDVSGMVTPLPEPPPSEDGIIQMFEVSSKTTIADPGMTVTLRWAFDGESGAICERITPRPLSDTCYPDLPSSGSLEVTVPAEARGAMGYFLYAHAGDQVKDALVILPLSAERGCEYEGFFGSADYAHQPLLECPISAPVEIRPQAQLFEKGLMLRLEGAGLEEGAWLVALLSQEGDSYSLGFQPVLDAWTPGMPETDAALTPPQGLFQPSRGFGMLWRGEIEYIAMADVLTLDGAEVLGWATGNVFEYDAVYQCYQGTHGRGLACFMSGPEGQVLPMPVDL
jgi:hypothetical protein